MRLRLVTRLGPCLLTIWAKAVRHTKVADQSPSLYPYRHMVPILVQYTITNLQKFESYSRYCLVLMHSIKLYLL